MFHYAMLASNSSSALRISLPFHRDRHGDEDREDDQGHDLAVRHLIDRVLRHEVEQDFVKRRNLSRLAEMYSALLGIMMESDY